MANGVNIDPRYLSYDKEDVEALLGKVDNADDAPTAESENMIKSGAVAAALSSAVAEVKEEMPTLVTNDDPASLLSDSSDSSDSE